MLKNCIKIIAIASAFAVAGFSNAQAWELDGAASKVSFGSVKKDKIGEVHSFENLSGSVSPEGDVSVEIDLTSVQTNIDIRNERMMKYVFGDATSAKLNAKVDMRELDAMEVGSSTVLDVEGTLSFLGLDVPIESEMFVAKLSETQVLVTTNDMIFVGTEDLGITAGIDKLMELAKLPGITRTSPIVLRLMFNNEVKKAEAAPAAPATIQVALTGDIKAGKKVFRRCKACHAMIEGKHGVGPSLHNIINAKAGAIEGYKYSPAMSESGLTWDVETLTAFLTKPKSVVKGTRMAFAGLKKEADIENLLAYIDSKSK